MNTRRTLVLALGAALLAGCQSEAGAPPPEGPCTESLELRAYAKRAATASGVRIFGETRAQAGVTVRAVSVAGQDVPLSSFNYRGWQVDLSQDLLEALAVDGVATISVTAYTNQGCAELPENARPQVSVSRSDDSNGGASGGGAVGLGGGG